MAKKKQFILKKWYFDIVTAEGEALICYSAKMTWWGFSVNYVSFLSLDVHGESHCESRFSNANNPIIEDNIIRWNDSGYKLNGEWVRQAEPLKAMLHDTEEGYLDWQCHQPVSKAKVQIGNRTLEGWGYVECLEMTIPPWEMDFNELRWGRFADSSNPLVWIELRGNPHRCWVFDGQNKVEMATVSDELIDLPLQQKKLNLSNHTIIEDKNKIMETVNSLVRWMPGFDKYTPLHFLQAREVKWRSNGALITANQAKYNGWVIHEVVKF